MREKTFHVNSIWENHVIRSEWSPLSNQVNPNVRPPTTHNYKPLDYYDSGIVEKENSKDNHNNNDSLKAATGDVMSITNNENQFNAFKSFEKYIKAVI